MSPLRWRFAPDVFIADTKPITQAQVAAVKAKTGATHTLSVAVGQVRLGQGSTLAVGVNPSNFRPWTPKGTAESDPLWATVAGGSVAVAHTVAKALNVALGGETSIGSIAAGIQPMSMRVGALATTGLPGVGVTVDQSNDAALGLTEDSGLILVAPGQDPVVTAALATQVLGPSAHASALRLPVSDTGRLTWVAPAVGPITAGFGYRQSPLVPGKREFHGGIDIGAPLNAPIYAASAGVVAYAGPAEGFGNEVVITHPGDVQTVYGHMRTMLVTAGQAVTAGQPIALVGSEGESTGPHLHFEVHVASTATDPLAWLVAHGVQVQH